MFTMTYLKILMMIRGGIIEDKSGNGRNLVIAINPNITDSYIGDGFIPKGIKQEGFKELHWMKSDLDIFLNSKN